MNAPRPLPIFVLFAFIAVLEKGNAQEKSTLKTIYSQMKLGMTEMHVEKMIGRKADRAHRPWDSFPFMKQTTKETPEWEKVWDDGKDAIVIHLDKKSFVTAKGIFRSLKAPE